MWPHVIAMSCSFLGNSSYYIRSFQSHGYCDLARFYSTKIQNLLHWERDNLFRHLPQFNLTSPSPVCPSTRGKSKSRLPRLYEYIICERNVQISIYICIYIYVCVCLFVCLCLCLCVFVLQIFTNVRQTFLHGQEYPPALCKKQVKSSIVMSSIWKSRAAHPYPKQMWVSPPRVTGAAISCAGGGGGTGTAISYILIFVYILNRNVYIFIFIWFIIICERNFPIQINTYFHMY